MTVRTGLGALLLVAFALDLAACGGSEPAAPAQAPPAGAPAAAPAPAADEEPLPPSQLDTELPEGVQDAVLSSFTGDFDEMVKRRVVRIGVTFNRTMYFVDKGVQRGVAYDYGRFMEERINTVLKTGNMKVIVFFVPMPHEMLIPALVDGKVDLVAGRLTITPERQKLVDFSNPTRSNVNEILVTGPGAAAPASIDDLAGKVVYVRKDSSYHQSLLALNDTFKSQGKAPVDVRAAPENLDDDDLLEMVNAGLLPAIIVDDYLARFWKQIFPDLTLHEHVAVRTGGQLAVAFRKNSPQLRAALDKFLGTYGLGTAFGNQVERRYLKSTKYVKNAAAEAERKKFLALVKLFQKYSDKYDLDFLLMAAQGYQESQLNQEARSQVGAIGVMQVMPATGKDMKVGDITQIEPNIHAGVKYMRGVMDAFFSDEPMDALNKGLFTFASYNAGPGRIRQLRREAEKKGLNPNVWFGNVERVASERIGRETVTYVSNIYKYYVAYRLVVEENQRREAAKATLKAKDGK
jgi:membrane-bound lytic murein transglycosylase MltF